MKSDLETILYFVYFGKEIDDAKVKKWINNKKNKFPLSWKILNFREFQKELDKYYPYKAI
ncbi:MAG: hypothetical protein COX29_01355 [Candidatus Moranbacteria bacterium CG23_combo_of_CG06-09_8_20_14_all_35_22]|nr:MAG: hypothetical protein COX29_01355 [Candidatus Moranbacteria bacterium CG23_combo_of_CG06-09_8_20_14_all_35_22]